ncbi:hypothetical protein LWI29_000450 [Acer saccharum]|uniref:Uncharacterized protein n=1 Tax=Acer saccharum TaxID=4024 RepID=A0AA39SJ80_ACESA|nr:hypothetical protein LWI29_000450 [Acer saccharum]
MVVLMAARASRLENQDAIDGAIVAMLSDPKETDKRTALSYLDFAGKVHRVSKGAPEQILDMAHNKSEIEQRVHAIINKFADRGLRSLGVARQVINLPLVRNRRRLGMGTNMYPSSALLGVSKDETSSALPFDDLIEKADGVAGVFPVELPLNYC